MRWRRFTGCNFHPLLASPPPTPALEELSRFHQEWKGEVGSQKEWEVRALWGEEGREGCFAVWKDGGGGVRRPSWSHCLVGLSLSYVQP